MSKAAAAPPPPEFDAPGYGVVEGADKAEALQGALEHVLHKFNFGLAKQHHENKALEFAVDTCLEACLTVVDMQYVPREDHPVSVISQRHASWEPEEPPQPCAVDSWLRAAIPDAPPPMPGDPMSYAMQAFLKSQTSVSSRIGSPSTRGEGASTPGTPKGGTRGSVPGSPMRPRTGGTGGPGSPLRPAISKVPNNRPQPTDEELLLEGQLRSEIGQRKAQAAISQQLAHKDAEERAKLATLRKELRGRDYGYDHKGSVVPLSEFDAERTPLDALSGPAYAVKMPDPDGGRDLSPRRSMKNRAGNTSSSGVGGTSSKTLSPSDARKAKERQLQSDFKKTASKTQPSAMDTMHPTMGVTLRQGGSAKSGPQKSAEAQGMTPENYKKFLAKQAALKELEEQQKAAGIPPGGLSRGGVSFSNGSLAASFSSRAAGAQSFSGRGGAAGGQSFSKGAPGQQSMGRQDVSPSKSRFAGSAVAQQIPQEPPSVLEAYGNDYDVLRDAKPKAPVEPPKKPPTPDANLTILTASDWGLNTGGRGYEEPASLPISKPSDKQLQDTVGRTARLPRERAPLPTAAPPLVPSKIGVGKDTSRLQFKSVISE